MPLAIYQDLTPAKESGSKEVALEDEPQIKILYEFVRSQLENSPYPEWDDVCELSHFSIVRDFWTEAVLDSQVKTTSNNVLYMERIEEKACALYTLFANDILLHMLRVKFPPWDVLERKIANRWLRIVVDIQFEKFVKKEVSDN